MHSCPDGLHCAPSIPVRWSKGEGVAHVIADLAPDNAGMRELLADEGFAFDDTGETLVATLAL